MLLGTTIISITLSSIGASWRGSPFGARKSRVSIRFDTLATRLLEKGTPLPTIAEILGHTSLESTRIYAKADVEALRGVALDPEEVNHAS